MTNTIGYISAHIHTKVISKYLTGKNASTFLFCDGKLVTAFGEQIGSFWQKHKEEDNILYLHYAETDPF